MGAVRVAKGKEAGVGEVTESYRPCGGTEPEPKVQGGL